MPLPRLLQRAKRQILDAFQRANGPAGAGWSAGQIAGKALLAAPTLGTEKLTTLHGSYAAGLSDALTKMGNPTLAQRVRGTLTGWTPTLRGGAAEPSPTAHAGTYGVRLAQGGSGTELRSDAVAVTAGTRYLLDCWTQGDGTNAGRYGLWDLTHGAWIDPGIIVTGQTAAAWAEVAMDYVAPTGCTQVQVVLMPGSTLGATCHFDDVSLRACGANMAPDADFEAASLPATWHVSAGTVERVTDHKHGGAASLHLYNNTYAYLMDEAGSVPAPSSGQVYVFSGWALAGVAGQLPRVNVQYYNGSWQPTLANTTIPAGTGAWQKWAFRVTCPASTTHVNAFLRAPASAYDGWFDDVCYALVSGAELLTNGSFEIVTGTSSAQAFQAAAQNDALSWGAQAGVAGQFAVLALDAERLAGTLNTVSAKLLQGATSALAPIQANGWNGRRVALWMPDTTNVTAQIVDATAGTHDQVVIDNGSLKYVAPSGAMALRRFTSADMVVRGSFGPAADHCPVGMMAGADAGNCIYAELTLQTDGSYKVGLYKLLAGVRSQLVAPAAVTWMANAWLDVRKAGTAVSVWYDGTQVGSAVLVSPADDAIIKGRKWGVFSLSDKTTCNRVWVGKAVTVATLARYGSSITYGSGGTATVTNCYGAFAQRYGALYLQSRLCTIANRAQGGSSAWQALRQQDSYLEADGRPAFFLFDTANNPGSEDPSYAYAFLASCLSTEAVLRKLWTAYPGARVILLAFPKYAARPANTDLPVNATALANLKGIASYYGVPVIDFQAIGDAYVAGGGLRQDLFADQIHPSDQGHGAVAAAVAALLTPGFLASPAYSGALPSPYQARATEYQNAAQTITASTGTRVGTWSTAGGHAISSTPGDTVAYTFIGSGFDIYAGQPAVDYQVDGGAWVLNQVLVDHGLDLGSRGTHTVALRVRTTLDVGAVYVI